MVLVNRELEEILERPRYELIDLPFEQLLAEQLVFYRAEPGAAEKLLAQGDRKRTKDLNPSELAAITLMVSTLINHDEFVIKR